MPLNQAQLADIFNKIRWHEVRCLNPPRARLHQAAVGITSVRASLTIVGDIDTVRNRESSLPGVPASLTHHLVCDLVVWESLVGPTDQRCLHPLAHAALRVIGWVEWVVGGVFPGICQEVGYKAGLRGIQSLAVHSRGWAGVPVSAHHSGSRKARSSIVVHHLAVHHAR